VPCSCIIGVGGRARSRKEDGFYVACERVYIQDVTAERRACTGPPPGTVATTDGLRIHVSPGLPRGEYSHPVESGGDRSGANCQKVSNSDNFTRKSKIDDGFLARRAFFIRPRPDSVPLGSPPLQPNTTPSGSCPSTTATHEGSKTSGSTVHIRILGL
jgi:hypothetical protein